MNKLLICIIAGMTTGMGNGSVFGATLMCFLGRGKFEDWGGAPSALNFNPATFTGFVDWVMIVFGIAFIIIMVLALAKHEQLEAAAAR